MPRQSSIQLPKWLASSHHQIESYRSSVLPVTSTRNGAAISANPDHGGGAVSPRRRATPIQIAGGSSIISG